MCGWLVAIPKPNSYFFDSCCFPHFLSYRQLIILLWSWLSLCCIFQKHKRYSKLSSYVCKTYLQVRSHPHQQLAMFQSLLLFLLLSHMLMCLCKQRSPYYRGHHRQKLSSLWISNNALCSLNAFHQSDIWMASLSNGAVFKQHVGLWQQNRLESMINYIMFKWNYIFNFKQVELRGDYIYPGCWS